MSRHALRSVETPAGSVAAIPPSGTLAGTPSALVRRSVVRRWLMLLRPRLPRLHYDALSEHRLRDLGFVDGRVAPSRDPLRD